VRGRAGFTLLEVVVATGVLATGVVALVVLQAQSLEAQRRVRVVRELVGMAESELERRVAAATPAAGECDLAGSAHHLVDSCNSRAVPCRGAVPPCGDGSADRAIRVEVEVVGIGGERFAVRAITARFPP
jgi:type II secretory pathway component PulJ